MRILCAVVFISVLFVSAPAEAQSKAVRSKGTWSFAQGRFMSKADISGNRVVVTIGSVDSQVLYWRGTFKPERLREGQRVISRRGDKKLVFLYRNSRLSYVLKAFGKQKRVYLRK